jgi:hypothetical protein
VFRNLTVSLLVRVIRDDKQQIETGEQRIGQSNVLVRYLQPGVEEGTPPIENLVQHLDVGGDEAESRVNETPVFEKFNPLLHGGVTTTSRRGSTRQKEVLSIAFVVVPQGRVHTDDPVGGPLGENRVDSALGVLNVLLHKRN